MSPLSRIGTFAVLLFLLVAGAAAVAQTSAPDADQRPHPTIPPPPLTPPGGRGTELPLPPGEGWGEGLLPPGEGRAAGALIPWSRLVYYARAGGNWDIYSSDDDGANLRRLTNHPAVDAQPDLSRGGARIVFVSDADGDFDLFTMTGDGLNRARLLDTLADEYDPVWSPDGGRIAFRSEQGGQPEIYVIDADGGNLIRLTDNPDFDGHPTWSPDGTRLAFASRRDGQYRIWRMDADGSGLVRLSDQPGSMYPAWSPGGGAISFSADANNDGWLDLFHMASDGTVEVEARRAPANHDLLARSGLPNSSGVAYTDVRYVNSQGEWLVAESFMSHTSYNGAGTPIPTPIEFPCGPSWVTLDTQPPVTTIAPLPAVSPNSFTVYWSVEDPGGSGVSTLEVEVSVDGGPWRRVEYHSPGTSLQYNYGWGGQTIAFRAYASDRAANHEPIPEVGGAVTTIEALPPVTKLNPLPAFTHVNREFLLSWSGYDPGHSGISGYELEARRDTGEWGPAGNNPGDTELAYGPGESVGETVEFRLRASDNAHNVEPWSPDPGNMATTFYSWSAIGRVVDNAGAPVAGADVTTYLATLGSPTSGPDGEYARYLPTWGPGMALDWAKLGYGDLPTTTFKIDYDIAPTIGLPPADDVLVDGDFETGWGAWTAGGLPAPTLSDAAYHTGATSVQLGATAPLAAQERLSATPDEPESDVQISIDGAAVTVLWAEGIPDGSQTLRFARRTATNVWFADKLLDDIGLGYTSITHDDQLHVVAPTPAGLVYLVQINGSWSAPETIPSSAAAQEPQIVIAADGTPHVFWLVQVVEEYGFRLNTSRRGPGGWSAPVMVAQVGDLQLFAGFGVVAAPDGALHLIYLKDLFETKELWARLRRPDGQWTAARLLHSYPYMSWRQPPVITPDGRVFYLWSEADEFLYSSDLHYLSGDGVTWTRPQRVFKDTGIAEYIAGPDGSIHALVSWGYEVRYTVRTPDGAWLFPQAVPDDTSGDAKLVLDAAGLPHVFRASFDPEYAQGNLEYTRRLTSGSWTNEVAVSGAFDKNYRPAAAVDGGGNVHVAWLAEDGQTADRRADVMYAGPVLATAPTVLEISRTVVVPDTAAHPVLSFFYRFSGGATNFTNLVVEVTGGSPSQGRTLPRTGDEMEQAWLDLSGNVGQTVTITFRLTQAPGEPLAGAAVDDVTLGAAHGDVWLSGAAGAALPGRTITHELIVGNRGGVDADDVAVTYTLPPELSFVSADLAPDATGPLRWELGALAPDETRTIRVTLTVAPNADAFAALSATAVAVSPGELETDNNSAAVITRTEMSVFLPVGMR